MAMNPNPFANSFAKQVGKVAAGVPKAAVPKPPKPPASRSQAAAIASKVGGKKGY